MFCNPRRSLGQSAVVRYANQTACIQSSTHQLVDLMATVSLLGRPFHPLHKVEVLYPGSAFANATPRSCRYFVSVRSLICSSGSKGWVWIAAWQAAGNLLMRTASEATRVVDLKSSRRYQVPADWSSTHARTKQSVRGVAKVAATHQELCLKRRNEKRHKDTDNFRVTVEINTIFLN
jgi:hypothetical protein